jgi:hypothetical protein
VPEDAAGHCRCLDGWDRFTDFDERHVGEDPQRGRYAQVTVHRCRRCGRLWLRYHFEFEAYTGSGRWYRGLISPELAGTVTAGNAAAILEGLEWYQCGGSYHGGRVFRGSGPLDDMT